MADGLNSAQRAVNGERVRAFGKALGLGKHGLASIRAGICTLVRERAWQDFVIPDTGEAVHYDEDQFEKFVGDPPLRGLHTTTDTIAAFCEGDREAMAALDSAKRKLPRNGEVGGGHSSYYNIIAAPTEQQGTSREYTLRRLKRDRPDLAEMVIAGELSANAAAIEAGFRKRDTPLDALRRAWGKATQEERGQFMYEVTRFD